jgi:hypothetical protein
VKNDQIHLPALYIYYNYSPGAAAKLNIDALSCPNRRTLDISKRDFFLILYTSLEIRKYVQEVFVVQGLRGRFSLFKKPTEWRW